ncbi:MULTISPECIES: flagellin [unclassified Nitratiruptor]|uniref:flagellin N-terminal helical domain-containing protein n=1 Tax=unclassified Nitratiruptor TaxID=2624044 RepID=UPI00191548B9|nr:MULTISPECIES: flagellin [unclassified Nitratiruptor]BCD59939.1 flagellin [Nitratiruptor sp. YY08-10]BCD63862.1 flagellin [Nitratiruptor sp. YY08-14]
MALRVNYNFQADFGHVNLKKTENRLNTSLERLETGLRINSAKDDAAGLFIADQLSLVSKALDQGSRNANDGISAAQIAESTLGQIYDKLTSMYTKASQAANDTNDANARNALQNDIKAITDAIDRMAKASEFNGIKLLDGSFTAKSVQYGARAGQTLDISIAKSTADALGTKVLEGTGKTAAGNSGDATPHGSVADILNDTTNFDDFVVDSDDKFIVAGVDLKNKLTDGNATDAYDIATAINGDSYLSGQGITALAKNQSTADAAFGTLAIASGDEVDLTFYVGSDMTSANAQKFTLKYTSDVTLDQLISDINAQGQDIGLSASKTGDGKLVLETANGETIGLDVAITDGDATANTSVDLSTIIQGATTVVDDTNNTSGAAIKVGDLTIAGLQDSDTYDFTGLSTTTTGLGLTASGSVADYGAFKNLNDIDVTTQFGAELGMVILNNAIKTIDTQRSDLGSIQQNLQAIIDNNDFAATQTREAESRIRNVDFAKEMSEFTRQQTLMQSGMAMLAQANQLPQMVLQLLR